MKRFVGILILASLGVGLWGAPPSQAAGPAGDFVPGEVIIQYREGTGDAQQRAARGRVNATPRETLRPQASGAPGLEVAALPAGIDVFAAIARLQADPSVEFAEPNWIYTAIPVSTTEPYPTDRGFRNGGLWGLYGTVTPTNTVDEVVCDPGRTCTNPYGSRAADAWGSGRTGSDAIYIGVIDEGIRYSHPDLASNIWTNPGETGTDALRRDKATNGVDDDGSGYPDDVHGWDFINNNSTVFDGNATEGWDNHGTHVAGTIGAAANNTDFDDGGSYPDECLCGGLVGVNWNVTMISAKFLGPNGGAVSDAVRAVDYFTKLKTKHGLNIVALNNSWTGGGYSQALLNSIVDAARANILFIAAAGNDTSNNDGIASYPSGYDTTAAIGYDTVIAVTAIDRSGARPSWANWGARTVDLGAPGAGIWSTIGDPSPFSREPYANYAEYSGTSMATPHVAGAAALYASVYPKATAKQIRAALLNSTVKTSSLNRRTVTGGRLNIDAALKVVPR